MILENPAFMQFMLDVAADSKAYATWRLMIPHAFNLPAAWGKDVFGGKIEESDPFWWYCVFYRVGINLK